MNDRVFQVTVASPEELRDKLSAELKKGGFDYPFIALSLTDPRLYVYPFQMPKAPRKELLEHLIDEAVELSSLHINDIELDFQIFGAKEGVVEGVFACLQRKLLEDYLAVCDQAGLTPIHATAQLLRTVDTLYTRHKGEKDHFAVLDFGGDHRASVALFCKGNCEFLRQIKYETVDEARTEIVQSLRSACAKSQVKTIEHIYVGHLTDEAKPILSAVEKAIGAPILNEGDPAPVSAQGDTKYFTINLLGNHSFGLARRQQFTLGAHAVLGVLGLWLLLNLGALIGLQFKIGKITSSYKPADVQYARDLEKKLEGLK